VTEFGSLIHRPQPGNESSEQEFVRPRWPYDMRPSAEKYMCVIVIR